MMRKRKTPIRRKEAKATYNAATLERALREAEKTIVLPSGQNTLVEVSPNSVGTIPELFQPRTFTYGAFELNRDHVKKLARRIENKGELDPITVVKLARPDVYLGAEKTYEEWVCVDGHHRLAAYQSLKWKDPIRCRWFGGTAREAHQESLRANEVTKLEMTPADRQEQAWRLTLLGIGSKREVQKLTNVSEGVIAHMRRVKTLYAKDDKQAREFKRRLGSPLKTSTWPAARAAYLGLELQAHGADAKAGRLANVMRRRLQGGLSSDPVVTAKALVIYDFEMAEALVVELPKAVARAER